MFYTTYYRRLRYRSERKMPVEGFRSITVTNNVYEQLEKFAEKTKRSIPKAIEYLISEHKEKKA